MQKDVHPDYEILGLGAPFVDQIIHVSEDYLAKVTNRKGGTQNADYHVLNKIIEESKTTSVIINGGSCANTIKGLAHLGRKCALVGKIGEDPLGKQYLQSLQQLGIRSLYLPTATPTAQAVSLVTSDGERTMRSFLGASLEMKAEDLDPAIFKGVKLVHIEGYSLQNGTLTQKAMELAKNAGSRVSFVLSSYEIVDQYKDQIVKLIADYCDIVFADRQEIKALAQSEPEKGCDLLKDLCEIAVVTQGKDGCWVGHGNEKFLYPTTPVVPVDSTGAGDFFACGFLDGFLKGCSLQECARYGTLLGAAVVQVMGAELPQDTWEKLKKTLQTP